MSFPAQVVGGWSPHSPLRCDLADWRSPGGEGQKYPSILIRSRSTCASGRGRSPVVWTGSGGSMFGEYLKAHTNPCLCSDHRARRRKSAVVDHRPGDSPPVGSALGAYVVRLGVDRQSQSEAGCWHLIRRAVSPCRLVNRQSRATGRHSWRPLTGAPWRPPSHHETDSWTHPMKRTGPPAGRRRKRMAALFGKPPSRSLAQYEAYSGPLPL
jgi:hypothetical protein